MMQQAVDVIAEAIDANLRTALSTMPGADAVGLARGVEVLVTRNMVDDALVSGTPIGVRVEVQDTVTETWPFEAQDEETTAVQVGVTCWLSRPANVALRAATDDEMIRAVRALVRAVSVSIRSAFSPIPVVERDGVQIRCPRTATYGEPEQGDDGALTVITLSLSVPTLDHWALSAGGV
jgi:hypothetical protein